MSHPRNLPVSQGSDLSQTTKNLVEKAHLCEKFALKAMKLKTLSSSTFAGGDLGRERINLINMVPEKEPSTKSKRKTKSQGGDSQQKEIDEETSNKETENKSPPAEPSPPHAHVTEWCIDNRVLFHPLNASLDNSNGTTINEDVLEHLRKTILRPRDTDIPIHILDHFRMNILTQSEIEGRKKSPSSEPRNPDTNSEQGAVVGPVEAAFGTKALVDLVNKICMRARMMAEEKDPSSHYDEFAWRSRCWDYMLQECEEHVLLKEPPSPNAGPRTIVEMTSITRNNIELRLMLKQEQDTLYPAIDSYTLAVTNRKPMRDIYRDHSQGIQLHLQRMKKLKSLSKLEASLTDSEREARRIVMNLCQNMQDALAFQTTPIPEDEKTVPLNPSSKSTRGKDEAQKAWDESKLAWAKARVAQYPLCGIIDSTLVWKVTVPWPKSGKSNEHKLPQDTRDTILDGLECFPTQMVKKSKDELVKEMRPFYVPFLVTENKTKPSPISESDLPSMKNKARNQRLFYCVSALRMLAAMKIENLPIIGLATVGQHGTLCAGWWSKDYIPGGSYNIVLGDEMEEFQYDLTKEKDVLQLITVIFRLKELGFAMVDQIAVHITSNEPQQPWSLESQVKDLKLTGKDKRAQAN